MIAVWKDIDPLDAEGRLRGLRRRLAELDDAIKGQQAILRERPESFAFQLSCNSLLQMQEALRQEFSVLIRHRTNEKIDLALDGNRFIGHSASLGHLGFFFLRLQKLYSSIAQAIRTGPTLRGPIAEEIRSATDLRLSATYPSSFGMTLYVPTSFDLMGNSIAADSLDTMFQLLTSSCDEKRLMQFSGELGRRTFSHLRHVASSIYYAEADFKIEWSDFTGTRHTWETNANVAREIIQNLSNITETRSGERLLTGRLVGASLLRNRFELLLTDNTLVEGKVIADLSDAIRKAFGTVCKVRVNETEILDRGTGDRRTYYALIMIDDTGD